MNVVLVLIDSLNRHHLSAYADSPVATPNLDRFARKAWRFDNHFVGSLPCMPARREIFSGRKELLWRPWGPLEPYDDRLPRLLEGQGYSTAIVTDHYHYWEEAANGYVQSFGSAELVRGHEIDYWKQPVPETEPVPEWVERIEKWRPKKARQYYANVKGFGDEEDFFPAKVFKGASEWLAQNAESKPFFLQVESFDVHEPFHVPEPYASMYAGGKEIDGFNVWPPYHEPDLLAGFMADTTSEEIAFIRSQYYGKLTMVDRWFGELLDRLDDLVLWDDTFVVVTTDHGHDLGERERFGKQYPHFDTHANIPLFVWHPDHPAPGRPVSALTSTVDLFASLLEAAGLRAPYASHSRSFLPLLAGEDGGARQALLYGTFGQGVCYTDGEWTLFKSPEHEEPLNLYSSLLFQSLKTEKLLPPDGHDYYVPEAGLPQWRVPTRTLPQAHSQEDFLFHRAEDPGQTRNLWEAEPERRRQILDGLLELLDLEGTPPEQLERLGLGFDR